MTLSIRYTIDPQPTLADYEQYRKTLANDSGHKANVERLGRSGAVVSMARSIVRRLA